MMKTVPCRTCMRPVTSRYGVRKRCGSQKEKGTCAYNAAKKIIDEANYKRKKERLYPLCDDSWLNPQ